MKLLVDKLISQMLIDDNFDNRLMMFRTTTISRLINFNANNLRVPGS